MQSKQAAFRAGSIVAAASFTCALGKLCVCQLSAVKSWRRHGGAAPGWDRSVLCPPPWSFPHDKMIVLGLHRNGVVLSWSSSGIWQWKEIPNWCRHLQLLVILQRAHSARQSLCCCPGNCSVWWKTFYHQEKWKTVERRDYTEEPWGGKAEQTRMLVLQLQSGHPGICISKSYSAFFFCIDLDQLLVYKLIKRWDLLSTEAVQHVVHKRSITEIIMVNADMLFSLVWTQDCFRNFVWTDVFRGSLR